MDSYFRDALEGLQGCAKHLMAASQEINLAGAALVKVTTVAVLAKDEHGDLRETVQRLEETLMGLVEEMRAMREARQEPS